MDAKKVVQFKDAQFGDKGTIRAVFATLGVIDHDGDMILPGAIKDQRVRLSTWGHGSWNGGLNGLPVGKGRVYENGNDAVFEGTFFLGTTAGRETYETIKAMGDLQEYSFALPEMETETRRTDDGREYRAIKSVRVPEVSPVLLGAGIDTRTLDIKSLDAKMAIASHSTGTDDGVWDAGANERRVLGEKSASYYARVYAWKDPDGEVGIKSTYKFPHHFVGDGGEPGKASTRACSAGIASLNGGRSGAKIPDADRKGVWAHLARHLRDADQEPPELRAVDVSGMTFADHTAYVLAEVQGLADRVKGLADLRAEEGRNVSRAIREGSETVAKALEAAACGIEQAGQKQAQTDALWLEFQEITARGRR